jgi:hypothetical protein
MRWVRAIVCTLAFTAAAAAPARAETVVRWVTSIGVLTWGAMTGPG